MKEKRCPKCGGVMATGFVCDNTVSFWSDAPQSMTPTMPQHQGKPMHPISTFRCSVCGYIEWYAPPSEK